MNKHLIEGYQHRHLPNTYIRSQLCSTISLTTPLEFTLKSQRRKLQILMGIYVMTK